MADEENDTGGFNDSESKIIMVLMKHLKGAFDTDFAAAATELGYKNTKVLQDRWNQIKKKKKLGGAATVTATASAGVEKVTPNKGSGRKKAADDGTPKKRGRPKKGVNDEEKLKEENDAVETTEDPDGVASEDAAV